MQLHAGYILDSVWSKLVEGGKDVGVLEGLVKALSTFEVDVSSTLSFDRCV